MPYIDPEFWGKIWKAIQRILGALVLLGFHQLLDYLICLLFKKHEWLEGVVSEILLVAFLIIYLTLLLDMVLIFIPRRKKSRRVKRSVTRRT